MSPSNVSVPAATGPDRATIAKAAIPELETLRIENLQTRQIRSPRLEGMCQPTSLIPCPWRRQDMASVYFN
jgi:hypothetical protein